MKNIVFFCLASLFFLACNTSETNTSSSGDSQKSTVKSPVPSSEFTDSQWFKMGYDLEAGRPRGLKVGQKAPDFSLKAPNGKVVSLSETLKKQPVVILFYRGEWCPVCTRYLSAFQTGVPKITATGAKVIAIGPETNENIAKTIQKTDVNFDILYDADGSVMKNYDVLFDVTQEYQEKIKTALKSDIAKNNAQEKAQLPVPATYVIGQDGRIRFVQFDLNYKNRASIDDILENL